MGYRSKHWGAMGSAFKMGMVGEAFSRLMRSLELHNIPATDPYRGTIPRKLHAITTTNTLIHAVPGAYRKDPSDNSYLLEIKFLKVGDRHAFERPNVTQ